MTPVLQDILRFREEDFDRIRVRFSMSNGTEDPKEVYLSDRERVNTDWFLHSGKKYNNFKKGTIAISLVKVENDLWLLTTIKRIVDVFPPVRNEKWTSKCYLTEELVEYENFFGRTYVSFHKKTQTGKCKWNGIWKDLLISKIDSEEYGSCTFRGYKFELGFSQLKGIIEGNRKDWCEAFRHIQAVYLITDNANGRFYVGSATSSDDFLLGRWKTYVRNGHGGNVKLKELVERKGIEYLQRNFSYRILDYFSESYPQSKVIESETYWKEVFKSRKFGYNAN